MNDAGFFARVRSDAKRGMPNPGVGVSAHQAPEVHAPRFQPPHSPPAPSTRTEERAGVVVSSARLNESSSREGEPISQRPSGNHGKRLAPQQGINADLPVENATASRAGIESGSLRSRTSRAAIPGLDVETTQAVRQHGAGDDPLPTPAREPSSTPATDASGDTDDAAPQTLSREAAQPTAEGTEAGEPHPAAEVSAVADARQGANDGHRYTLGREQPDALSASSAARPEQRDPKPPRLHIGEVVIRVEEEHKPQGAKRGGGKPTPSDSQRLLRSL